VGRTLAYVVGALALAVVLALVTLRGHGRLPGGARWILDAKSGEYFEMDVAMGPEGTGRHSGKELLTYWGYPTRDGWWPVTKARAMTPEELAAFKGALKEFDEQPDRRLPFECELQPRAAFRFEQGDQTAHVFVCVVCRRLEIADTSGAPVFEGDMHGSALAFCELASRLLPNDDRTQEALQEARASRRD
jgi:hypothetical protein